jgi:hypothetical protein
MTVRNGRTAHKIHWRAALTPAVPAMVSVMVSGTVSSVVSVAASLAVSMALSTGAAGASVLFETSCESLRRARDGYVTRAGLFEKLCPSSPRAVADTPPKPSEGSSPDAPSTDEDDGSPLASATLAAVQTDAAAELGRSSLDRERMAHCAYIRRRESTIPVARFRFADEATEALARAVDSSIGVGVVTAHGAWSCAGISNQDAALVCEILAARDDLTPASRRAIVDEMTAATRELQSRNDRAAGAARMSVGGCADVIVKSGYSLKDILASRQGDVGEALSSSGAAAMSSVARTEDILSSAERRRLDRVYIDFMRRRIEKMDQMREAAPR